MYDKEVGDMKNIVFNIEWDIFNLVWFIIKLFVFIINVECDFLLRFVLFWFYCIVFEGVIRIRNLLVRINSYGLCICVG